MLNGERVVRSAVRRVIVFWIALLLGALICQPLAADDRKQVEEFSQSFVYVGSNVSSHVGGKTHTDQESHGPGFSAEEMARRQKNVRQFLSSKGGALSPQDVAEVYRLAGHFSVIHGMVGSGEINAATSRQLGDGRAKLVEMALGELAVKLKAQGNRLGVNDFGSGEVNAKTDMDMTLYPEGENIQSAWLTSEFKTLFKKLTRLDPGQMDVVVHRYDATIPDWRQQRGIADFEMKLRVGRSLLKSNPEAYFLEGAFVQEVMGRSVKEGAKTFRWLDAKDGQVESKRMNAAEVPQFFYRPDVKPRFAWGAAVGNWHFYNAHSGDAASQAKYLLRSLDEGAALALKADDSFRQLKRANYTDLPEGARRAVIQRLYGHLSPEARTEAFLALEVASDIRARKSKGLSIGDDVVLKPFIEHQRKMAAGLPRQDETVLLARARENYARSCQVLLVENIMQSAQPRFTDWLSPRPDDVAKRTVQFVDKNGDLQELKYTPDMQKRLQYAAFFELMDSVELLSPNALKRLKQENPRFSGDIEILEGIVKKRREMMLLPPDADPPPADALEMRRRAAQSVVDAYETLSRSSNGNRLLEKAKAGYAFGQAFENWAKTRMGDALVHVTGKISNGPLLDNLRLQTQAVDRELGSSVWLSRMTYANSVTSVLTEYVKQGRVNEQVLKTLLLEGVNYIPVVNMVVDIQRGGGAAVAQIFLVQFVPGYGQVMLVINTAKGLVNLGGAMVFEPLKRDKILFAYQGYLDPQDAGLIFPGVRRRIDSPRPALLHPVDPARSLTLDQKREGFYAYFSPRVHELVRRRVGFQRPEDKVELRWWNEAEMELLPQVVNHYVFQWWNAQGPFQGFDELTVKRPMDEYYGEEIRTELTRLLIQDYLTGKVIHTEKQLYKPLMDDLVRACAKETGVEEVLQAERKRIWRSDGTNELADSGYVTQGIVLDSMPRIEPGITISAAPQVIKERNATGREVERIESYGLRAIITASPDETHPGPFRVSWEMQPLDQGARSVARSGARVETETTADKVKVTALLLDANGRTVQSASLILPVRKERIDKPVDEAAAVKPGTPSTAITERKQPEEKRVDCSAQRDQYFNRCKQMADRQVERNCKRIYSGCALDVAGCLNAYIVGALPDDYCGKPGYIGCVTGPLEGYLACLQRCNDDFSAGVINTFGITPCRGECQSELDVGVKACKAGQTPPPPRTRVAAPAKPAMGSQMPSSSGETRPADSTSGVSQGPSAQPGVLELDTNRYGQDYRSVELPAADPKLCQEICNREPQCKAFTYVKPGVQGPSPRCWLKHSVPGPNRDPNCVSGVKATSSSPQPSRDATVYFGPLEFDQDRLGLDYTSFNLPAADPRLCQAACAKDARCKAFTYVKPGYQGSAARCWLKHSVPETRPNPCCVSGVKR